MKRLSLPQLARASLTLCLLLAPAALRADTLYVNRYATGAESGDSWANAYTNLLTALSSATAGDSVWIAQGAYSPDGTNYNEFFPLKAGVQVLGGFAGVETTASQANWRRHHTRLDGDIGTAGNMRDNTRQLVIASYATNAVLDGLYLINGSATNHINIAAGPKRGAGVSVVGAPIAIRHCYFGNNHGNAEGGAVYTESGATITSCVFSNNSSSGLGGALYAKTADVTIDNSLFVSNRIYQTGNGGAINFQGAHLTMRHCTFLTNGIPSTLGPNLVVLNTGTASIVNSIFWGRFRDTNTFVDADRGGGVSVRPTAGLVTLDSCLLQDGFQAPTNAIATAISSADPLFVDIANRNARLQSNSPCIDIGSLAGMVSPDLDGTARPQGAGPDLGAYEFTTASAAAPEPVADASATGGVGRIVLSWTNPTNATFAGVLIIQLPAGATLQGLPAQGVDYQPGDPVANGTVFYMGPASNAAPGAAASLAHAPLAPATSYAYTVFAYDAQTNIADGVALTGTSLPRPAPPTSPTATGAKNQINLTWTHATGDELQGVLILRRQDANPTGVPQDSVSYSNGATLGDGTVAYVGWGSNSTPGAASAFLDADLAGGTTYRYTLFSLDSGPNYSTSTIPVSATTLSLLNITDLTATPSDHTVSFTWTNATDPSFAGVLIIRSPRSSATNPVVWLPFTDAAGSATAQDASGHGNHAQVLASAGLAPAGGPTLAGGNAPLNAATFAGVATANNAIIVPDSASMDFNKMRGTVLFWVRPSVSKDRYCFVKTDPFGSSDGIEVAKQPGGVFGWPSGFGNAYFSSKPVPVATWRHVAYSWDASQPQGSNMAFFIDSALDTAASYQNGVTPGVPPATGRWVLGQDYDDNGGSLLDRYLAGSMAEFAVFDRVLTPSEIRTVYSNSLGGAASIVSPVEGVAYTNGQTIGNAVVAYAGPGLDPTPGALSGATDPGLLSAETDYVYAFFAYDADHKYAEVPVVQTNVTTLADLGAPGPVPNLNATAPAGDRVLLTWINPAAADLGGFILVRHDGSPAPWTPTPGDAYEPGTGTPAGIVIYAGPAGTTTPGAANQYTDYWTISDGTHYTYTLYAIDLDHRYSTPAQDDVTTPAMTHIFVNRNAVSGANNGTSWANAYTNLMTAMSTATSGSAIWVAEGTYKPSYGTDRNAVFTLRAFISVYGGFAGTESKLGQRRHAAHPTILSGDIGIIGDNTDNSLRVVNVPNRADGGVLDGFIVEKGYNTTTGSGLQASSVVTVRNCWFRDNRSNGSAVYILSASLFRNCRFSNNHSTLRGGAFQSLNASPTLENCLFHHNTCDEFGGAMALLGGTVTIRHCTFANNTSFGGGGDAIYASNFVTVNIVNSVLWDLGLHGGGINVKQPPGENWAQLVDVRDSDVRGGFNPPSQGFSSGVINADPLFIDEPGRNYRLQAASPCRDAGSDLPAISDDLDTFSRPAGAAYDMGAYEFDAGLPPDDTSSPEPVTDLAATDATTRIHLSWLNPTNTDFTGVLVLRLAGAEPSATPTNGTLYAPGATLGDATVVYSGPSTNPTPGAASAWTDSLLPPAGHFYYLVFAFDPAPNYSTPAFTDAILDPLGDADSDQMPNGDEDIAGTNPLDRDSSLRFTAIIPTGIVHSVVITDDFGQPLSTQELLQADSLILAWPSESNRFYRLYSGAPLPDISTPETTDLPPPPPPHVPTVLLTGPNAPFYRLSVIHDLPPQ